MIDPRLIKLDSFDEIFEIAEKGFITWIAVFEPERGDSILYEELLGGF